MKKNKHALQVEQTTKQKKLISIYYLVWFILLSSAIIGSAFLGTISKSLWFNEMTIHYFFSAIFQGFSALFGILLVAIVFYVNTTGEIMREIDKEITQILRKRFNKEFTSFSIHKDEIKNYINSSLRKDNVGEKGRQQLLDIRGYIWEYEVYEDKRKLIIDIIIFNVITMLYVIIVSIVGLTLCSGPILNIVFYNIFMVTMTALLSIISISLLGITLLYLMFPRIIFDGKPNINLKINKKV